MSTAPETIVTLSQHAGGSLKTVGSVNIGSLLLQADFIKRADLDDAISLSKKMKLPLGRMLVIAGHVSEQTLTAALAAQSFIRDKAITTEIAVKALKEAEKSEKVFADVLLELGLNQKLLDYTNKLGQLLADSEYITERQRLDALQMALESSLPLGRILIMQKVISGVEVYAALSAQILVRTGEISRENAVIALKAAKANRCPLEIALKEQGFISKQSLSKIMLGELLMISDQLSEVRFLTGLEKSLIEDIPLGKVLVDLDFVSQSLLDRALDAQKKLAAGKMTQLEAAEYLRAEDADNSSSANADAKANNSSETEPKISVQDLLVLSKALTHGQLSDVESMSNISGESFEKMLLASGMVAQDLYDSILAFKNYCDDGVLSLEQSLIAINIWRNDRAKSPAEIAKRMTR